MNNMYYLFIVDDDNKKFNIVKVFSDKEINKRVINLQEQGRDVRCFSSLLVDESNLEKKAAEYEKQTGYLYVLEDILK